MKIRISKIINKIQSITDLEDLLYRLRQHDWGNDKRFEEIISEINDDFNMLDLHELDPDKVQDYVNMLLQAIDDEFYTEIRQFLLSYECVKNKIAKKMEIKWDWGY